jgi:hypothetical protein
MSEKVTLLCAFSMRKGVKNTIKYSNLENKNRLYSIINSDTKLYSILKEDIYYDNTILEKMEKLRTLNKQDPEYNKLYQDIISVGEFIIEKKTVTCYYK